MEKKFLVDGVIRKFAEEVGVDNISEIYIETEGFHITSFVDPKSKTPKGSVHCEVIGHGEYIISMKDGKMYFLWTFVDSRTHYGYSEITDLQNTEVEKYYLYNGFTYYKAISKVKIITFENVSDCGLYFEVQRMPEEFSKQVFAEKTEGLKGLFDKAFK